MLTYMIVQLIMVIALALDLFLTAMDMELLLVEN